MSFYERLDAAVELLRHRRRVSYRALKRELGLDDGLLEDIKVELIEVQRLARDEHATVLVWIGGEEKPASEAHEPAIEPHVAPAGAAEAARRQVTVMFCDLVRAPDLAACLDPEELRDLLRAYHETAGRVVRRFDGVIARSVQDGLLIYFGFPRAHEDDAERAVRAGLGLVGAVRELDQRLRRSLATLRDLPLQIRVGMHTGLAVMGSMGDGVHRDDMAAVGETPNLAARIHALADPDAVLLTAATHRLLRGSFVCTAIGPRALKGFDAPVAVYRALREVDAAEAVERHNADRTPIIGRGQEAALLLDRWEQVNEGLGQVVLLTGEAGIGKSRLVQLLKAHAAGEPHLALDSRGSPFHQNTALYPLIELLHQALGIERGGSADEQMARLQRAVEEYRFPSRDQAVVLASLLGVPIAASGPPSLTLGPERLRQQTLEAIVALIAELAARQRVLLIVEDLHWVDPSTRECLELLIEQAPTMRILVLLTTRPELRPSWAARAHVTPLALGRFRRHQIEALITSVAGGKELPPAVVDQIATKTDGVPLFIEELTKMVIESGLLREEAGRYRLVGPLPPLAIPATLQDSLMARLDRLAAVRAVAQVCATIGRSCAYGLVRAAAGLDDTALQRALDELVDAELLYQRGAPPQAIYTFKHALIQDAAYQTLLKGTRQHYHERIARGLAGEHGATVDTPPEVLAHHYTEAGLLAEAVHHWRRAGEHALARFANLEAISHLSRSLNLLGTLPDTADRARQELRLQLTLAVPLIVGRSWAAPEVERAYARARDLARELGEPPHLLRALRGLATLYWTRGELRTALGIAEECFTLSQEVGEPANLRRAHLTLGYLRFLRGDLSQARAHLEHALVDDGASRSHSGAFVQDPVVTARSCRAATLWLLGFPDQARGAIEEAVRFAEALAHPFSLATALYFRAIVHQMRRESPATQSCAESLMALSSEHGFAFWNGAGMITRGWALAEQGHHPEAIAEIRRGLDLERSTGTELSQPHGITLLADAYGRADLVEEGLAALAQALDVAQRSEERMYEAEIHRLRGELLARQGRDAEAESALHMALDVARAQQARSLELRAAMSLVRLRAPSGRTDGARRALADVLGWFSEGFDTADLRDARALLDADGA